jgi:tRNA nucleotidyltransferase (CCA-adding enzyme)
VDMNLAALMASTDLSELPGERLYGEWNKLLGGRFVGDALRLLLTTNLLKQFPELWSMVGTPQDREWHPEGDVFEHTCLAVDRARELSDDPVVLWAVLLHDAGKPATTKLEEGRIRARGHEDAGVAPSRAFFNALRAPDDLKRAVCALVEHHLAPAHFVPDEAHAHKRTAAGASAYRRLARKLGVAGTDLKTLYLVSKADHFGRTTKDAIARVFPSGEAFLERATAVQVDARPEPDAVLGRDLIARGFAPGPQFGEILAKCREVQYDRGLKDPDAILKEALAPN